MGATASVWHKQNCLKHFRSEFHFQNVVANADNSTALRDNMETAKGSAILSADIPAAIIDDAIVSCSRKSLSLTAIPVVLDVVARALLTCRGKKPLDHGTISKIRAESDVAARSIQRLNAATSTKKTRSGTSLK